jgi:hypothetical protein
MMQQLPWIFLTFLAGIIAVISRFSDPLAYWQASITDWIVAVATFLGVVVATIAAIFLKRTLEEAQNNNTLLSRQLAAQGPLVICDADQAPEYYFPGEEAPTFQITCKLIWSNTGEQTAVNSRFWTLFKDDPDEIINVVDALERTKGIHARTFQPGKSELVEIPLIVNFDRFKRASDGHNSCYFSCFTVYQDSLGQEYIVEQGYRLVLLESPNKYPPTTFQYRVGPNNRRLIVG